MTKAAMHMAENNLGGVFFELGKLDEAIDKRWCVSGSGGFLIILLSLITLI